MSDCIGHFTVFAYYLEITGWGVFWETIENFFYLLVRESILSSLFLIVAQDFLFQLVLGHIGIEDLGVSIEGLANVAKLKLHNIPS